MNNELQTVDAPEELEFVRLNQVERPKRIFFYRHKDGDGDVDPEGEVFACGEHEAALFGKFHKLIGVGDGVTYFNHIKNQKIPKNKLISLPDAKRILKEAFELELASAIGKKQRPKLQNVHFDSTILAHPNGDQIMNSFQPPV